MYFLFFAKKKIKINDKNFNNVIISQKNCSFSYLIK